MKALALGIVGTLAGFLMTAPVSDANAHRNYHYGHYHSNYYNQSYYYPNTQYRYYRHYYPYRNYYYGYRPYNYGYGSGVYYRQGNFGIYLRF